MTNNFALLRGEFTFVLMGHNFRVIVCRDESGFASHFYGKNTVSKFTNSRFVQRVKSESGVKCSVHVDRGTQVEDTLG